MQTDFCHFCRPEAQSSMPVDCITITDVWLDFTDYDMNSQILQLSDRLTVLWRHNPAVMFAQNCEIKNKINEQSHLWDMQHLKQDQFVLYKPLQTYNGTFHFYLFFEQNVAKPSCCDRISFSEFMQLCFTAKIIHK